mgnify:CR=1 FL=1
MHILPCGRTFGSFTLMDSGNPKPHPPSPPSHHPGPGSDRPRSAGADTHHPCGDQPQDTSKASPIGEAH